MEQQTKKVFKIFTVWQDELEEAWLTEMANKGWLFQGYKNLVYTFVKAEPGNYIYKLDYKTSSHKDLNEYKALFEDLGWEHVGKFRDWQYFRTVRPQSEMIHIYSDQQSKVEKYKRILNSLLFSFIGMVFLFNSFIFRLDYEPAWGMTILKLLFVLVILLGAFGIFKTYGRIRRLKNRIGM